MNGNAEQFIQDLIHTSVLETIKSNTDIERLIENGLLKLINDIPKIVECTEKILPH